MDLTSLYCDVDDLVKNNISLVSKKIESQGKRKYEPRDRKLSQSEVMTICIAYHQSGYKNFKAFFTSYVTKHMRDQFPDLVSYNRFVELMPENLELLAMYLSSRFDNATGISYIDSTKIQVCKPKRIKRNKVFKDTGKIGKSSMGWFFGFKLHLLVNECGGILSVRITQGNVDDRRPVLDMVKNIFGKLFGDKGYISQKLTDTLLDQGINLITSVKKNMKNKLLAIQDKILLRKRSIIETINDQLKNISDIEHSRHRSLYNFMVNMLCGLIAYTHQPKKPRISDMEHSNEVTILAIS